MANFFPENWADIFQLQTPVLELVGRASLLYLAILILMRFMPRRTGGELATMDLVFVVLIADAASHSLAVYTNIADGIIVVMTLMAVNYLINALSYRLPVFEWMISAPPLQIIRDGELLRRNMRREFITEEELISHLREQGIDDIKNVKSAYVEGEGKLTAIPNNRGKE